MSRSRARRSPSSSSAPASRTSTLVRSERHRRAQLVRGVGHELALRGLRGLHAIEHRVEALRHPADLVLAARADAPPQVTGRLDVLGRVA